MSDWDERKAIIGCGEILENGIARSHSFQYWHNYACKLSKKMSVIDKFTWSYSIAFISFRNAYRISFCSQPEK